MCCESCEKLVCLTVGRPSTSHSCDNVSAALEELAQSQQGKPHTHLLGEADTSFTNV